MQGFTGSHNPLLVNYFQFVMDRVPNMTYFCQTANLPGLGLGAEDQPTPFAMPLPVPTGAVRFEDLQLSFKVDENLKNWLEIYNWIKRSSRYGDCDTVPFTYQQSIESNGFLLITNSTYRPKIKISFLNLFPISLSGIGFSTALPDSMEAIANVTFKFTNYKVELLDNP